MEYTSKLFVNFLNKLFSFNKEVKDIFATIEEQLNGRESIEKKEWDKVINDLDNTTQKSISKSNNVCFS